MNLFPESSCYFQTKSDTRVDFDPLSIIVKYYNYEGNNLPWISLCKLKDKVAHTLLMAWP